MTETELKLALPMHPAATLARRVAALPLLAEVQGRRETLHNIYYDTPDHALLRQGAVLRLRKVRAGGKTLWLQTFKTAPRNASALSRRGEWESPLEGPALSAALLQDTPWQSMDPDGRLFDRLQPCFDTRFTRTRWICSGPGGSKIELALDIGNIVRGAHRLPIREIELELKSGSGGSLLTLASALAEKLPCIPATQSKSERGYALAGRLPPAATADHDRSPDTPPLRGMAQAALQEAYAQFTTHLIALYNDDDPEHVHQARVGWRRLRSAQRLFKPILCDGPDLPLAGLQPLLAELALLRERDVACADSLPPMALPYIADDSGRAAAWKTLMDDLHTACTHSRTAVRTHLATGTTAQALVAVAAWLEALAADANRTPDVDGAEAAPRAWARRRLRSQNRALRQACRQLVGAAAEHHARILAKRLRYGVECLGPLLPKPRAQRWHRRALRWQSTLGQRRDAEQAVAWVASLPGHQGIAEFLRGFVSAGSMAETGQPKA